MRRGFRVIVWCVFAGVLCCALPAPGQSPQLSDRELADLMQKLREAPTTRPAGRTNLVPLPGDEPPWTAWPRQMRLEDNSNLLPATQPADLPPWAPRPAPADLVLPPTSTWPRTPMPVFGSVLVWLEAELVLDEQIKLGTFLSDSPGSVARLRELALAFPESAGPAWAKLVSDHPSYNVRDHALKTILDGRNTQLHTPAIRQILFDAGVSSASNTFTHDVEKGFRLFGKDQLQPLSDAEFLRQLALVMRGTYCHYSEDVFELYLQEVMRRKLQNIGDALDVKGSTFLPHRVLMLRTARNRSLDKPDPLTFKVVRNPNDPRIVEIELALTDPEWVSYDLDPLQRRPFSILVELKFPNGQSKVWTEKRPDRVTLQPGKPIRTAVSTELIRQAHTVVVSLPQFPYPFDASDARWLGSQRVLSFTRSVDMPALP